MIFFLFIFCVAIILLHNIRRSQKKIKFELIPNCLVLDVPIVFVEGKKSLFYFLNYWNFIPYYMKEHGYEVHILRMPWRNQSQRKLAVLKILDQSRIENKQVLMVYDKTCEEIMQTDLIRHHPSLIKTELIEYKTKNKFSSLSWFHRCSIRDQHWNPQHLGVGPEAIPTANEVLHRAISLAEKRFQCSHNS